MVQKSSSEKEQHLIIQSTPKASDIQYDQLKLLSTVISAKEHDYDLEHKLISLLLKKKGY
ncbi:20645_t:CDS:2 [Entrophospora sp. SA101]|nr:20645_t:CDS:2 [Entrophospora sp. SA101]